MTFLQQWSNSQASENARPDIVYHALEQDPEEAQKPETQKPGTTTNKNRDRWRKFLTGNIVFLLVCTGLITALVAIYLISDLIIKSKTAEISAEINLFAANNVDLSLPKGIARFKVADIDGHSYPAGRNAPQCSIDENNRFDCWPEYVGATKDKCEQRGCCWKPAATQGAPYCYFPSNFDGYTASNVKMTSQGVTADLSRISVSIFPPDIKQLKLKIDFQTQMRLRVKIFDPANARFEPPVTVPSGSAPVSNPEYNVQILPSPFNIVITRKSSGAIVFDTRSMAPFIFADQFLQIGTKLSTPYLYGLGEHRHNFLQEIHTWRKLVFWNRDDVPRVDNNGYGSHPFYLNLEPRTGNSVPNAHGVLLLNSNAGEAALQPYGGNQTGAVTYRFIGGVIDMIMLLGGSPLDVAAQYSQMVGPSYMPPFWSLGFHLCRWGYNSSSGLATVIKRNRDARIPYDVQWNDIDYMDKYKDWTYSQENYKNLPAIVDDLHKNKQRYIIMADPAISSSQPAGSYPPFDDGKQLDTFVKNSKGEILIGKVWPGETAFPDFFHPSALPYWYKQMKGFHAKLPFDGLWIDMNEPSSFIDGAKDGCPKTSKYNNPPYTPGTIDSGSLVAKTICPSAKHYLSEHYNLHNMYGWSQANVTRAALDTLYGNKRSPIISRSTFVGSGRYTGHWLGDNDSNFKDMAFSIAGILNFNLFGIPLIGADICGFRDQTTPELCTRWHQLGVFYPFMRNHADIASKDQDPASFQAPYLDSIRKALNLRYSLLAVLYTAFFNANTKGLPIVRPLFYTYPGTEAISYQFMWNDQLLVSPVLTQGATSVKAFIPKDTFYDFYTGRPLIGQGENVTLEAGLDTIPVHIRAGSILPLLPPTQRTDDSRNEKFIITVANAPDGLATGQLYWDDGESNDSIRKKLYTLIQFRLNKNTFTSDVAVQGYFPSQGIHAGQVMILGIPKVPKIVLVNGGSVQFLYNPNLQTLNLPELNLDLQKSVNITWS